MSYAIDPVKPYMQPAQNYALGGAVDDSEPGSGGGGIDGALDVIDQALQFGRQANGLGGQQQQAAAMPMVPGKQSDYPGPAPRPQPGSGPQAAAMPMIPGNQSEYPGPAPRPQPGGQQLSALPDGDGDEDTANGRIQTFDDGGLVQEGSDDSTDSAGGPAPVDNQEPDQNNVGAIPPDDNDQSQGPLAAAGMAPHQLLRSGAQRIINYLRGGDGDQNLANQMAKQVDPHGQMDEDERNIAAVKAASDAGGQAAAWKVVQANRQAFNAKQAFARAALNGVEGKPPDIAAAAKAATQAFPHMLDGTKTEFTPSQNGVNVTLTRVGQANPFQTTNLSASQFNDLLNMSKDGLYDNLIETGVGPVIQQLKGKPGTPVQGAQGANSPVPFTGAQPGAQRPTQQAQANEDIDPEVIRRANRIFPNLSQMAQRNDWIRSQIEAKQERGSKLEVAGANQAGRIEAARQTGLGRTEAAKQTATGRVEASKNYAGGRVEAARLQADARSEVGRQQLQAALVRAGATVLAKQIGNVPFGTELTPEAAKAAADVINRMNGGGAAAPASAAPAKAAAPSGGLKQGDVKSGYRYKGGPPGDKNSWEPVQ